MKEMLAVFDRDEAYLGRLSGALMRRVDCPYEVRTVTDGEDLRRLALEGRIAVLLLGEGAEEKDFDRSLAQRTVRLSAVREDSAPGAEDRVYKYQPVAGLLQALTASRETGREEAGNASEAVPDQGLIGVASPVGRCGKTAFALTLSRLLGEEKKVLDLDLQAFSGLGGFYEKPFRYGLSDLLYAERVGLSARDAEAQKTEDFIVNQWGLHFAVPADSPEVILETPPAEIVRITERLYASGPYDAAVLDLGTEYRLIGAFLPKLRKLYIPTLEDASSRTKTELFLEWVRKNSMKHDLPIETLLLPPAPPVVPGEDPVEKLLFSEMGSFVRKMLAGEA